ncbi:2Fe-2S iron-sulfur cluster-binding protein [Phytohabitans suffuscus]
MADEQSLAPPPSAEVTVEPLGARIETRDGESLIEAAWRSGFYWPTVCGGRAECTACVIRILSGGEQSPPPDAREAGQLERVRRRTGETAAIRLACCIRPAGTVVVEKKGVRRRLR